MLLRTKSALFSLLCASVARAATAAPCPSLFSLGQPACTLADGTTISNLRAAGTTTGNAALPASFSDFWDVSANTPSVGSGGVVTAPLAGTITLEYAYTLTAAEGKSLTKVSVNFVYGFSRPPYNASLGTFVCVRGLFSALPVPGVAPAFGSCSGLLTSLPNTPEFASATFTPSSNIDVLEYVYVAGGTNLVGWTATFQTSDSPPPPAPAPIPSSGLLFLIGLAGLLLCHRKRRIERGSGHGWSLVTPLFRL